MKDCCNQTELPSWFNHISSSSSMPRQMSLFTESLDDEHLARLLINPGELARWYGKRWVSFDASNPLKLDSIHDPRSWELYFVRDIVRSGLTDAQLSWLLEQYTKTVYLQSRPCRLKFSPWLGLGD
jgi:hypothetical protein